MQLWTMRCIGALWFVTTQVAGNHAQMFQSRPQSFGKPFPDPQKFHEKLRDGQSPRRLGEGNINEAKHYSADDGGWHFDLDLAGTETEVNVLNLDELLEVEAMACEEEVIYLQWRDGAPVDIHEGDVLHGGKGWKCVLEGAGAKATFESFLVEVLRVETKPLGMEGVTKLRVQQTSVFHVFPELALNYTWSQNIVRDPGRRLTTWTWNTGIDLNYDADNDRRRETFSVGPFECADCWAEFDITPTFTLDSRKGRPTKVKMGATFGFRSRFRLEEGSGSWDISGGWWRPEWLEALTNGAISLLRSLVHGLLSMLVPLYGWASRALSKITLNLDLNPTLAWEFLMQIENLVMEGAFQVDFGETVHFEVGWSMEEGITRSLYRTVDPVHEVQFPQRLNVPLLFGISLCFGLELTIYESARKITSFEACPEFRLGVELSLVLTDAEPFFTPTDEPDKELCVDDLHFFADGDADWLDVDEPYIHLCVAGQCKQTHHTTFGYARCPCGSGSCGKTWSTYYYRWCYVDRDCPQAMYHSAENLLDSSYYWAMCTYEAVFDDNLCFDIKGTWLADQPLIFSAYDDDMLFDDPYAKPFEIFAPSLADGGFEGDVKISMDELHGTHAVLSFDVVVWNRWRRLSPSKSMAGRRTEGDCSGGKVQVSAGIHGYFGGVHIPYGKRGNLRLIKERDFDSWVVLKPYTVYCAGALVIELPATTTLPPFTGSRYTEDGCACQQTWIYQNSSCGNYCCNPDADDRDWCYIETGSCQSTSGWGYCAPPITEEGCECLKSWAYGASTCSDYCCPILLTQHWCYVNEDSCPGSWWGYCATDPSSVVTTTMTTHTATTTTVNFPRRTMQGCSCRKTWGVQGYEDSPCFNSCCNPNGMDQDWCYVEASEEACQQSNWGYCAPITDAGCECQQSWTYGDLTCADYCCDFSLFGTPGTPAWCYIVEGSCPGESITASWLGWGYCSYSSASTSIPTVRVSGAVRVTTGSCDPALS